MLKQPDNQEIIRRWLGRLTSKVCVIGRFKPAAGTPAVPGFPFRRGILNRGWKAAHYFLLFLV
jgi:hypothetical protein